MQTFTRQVISIISKIPHGKVTTYGIIAASAGNHCGARQVARILHSSSDKYKLPWHRVVNVKGEIPPRKSMSHLTQKQLLRAEDVSLINGRVDLETILWIP